MPAPTPAPRKARKSTVGKATDPTASDAVAVDAAETSTATAIVAAKRSGKRVLLVDDDNEIVESMRAVLESRGYEILVARDGNQGLMMAEKDDPDLVVLDMMMPKRSGFLVLERLRRSRPVPMKVIMITANEGSRHKAYAEMLGVDDYIRKPFAMDRLLESVDRLLS
jgi:DNA-binding response OmpR family regulator